MQIYFKKKLKMVGKRSLLAYHHRKSSFLEVSFSFLLSLFQGIREHGANTFTYTPHRSKAL